MKISEVHEYDTVKMNDGQIGIVIEKSSDGKLMLEQRQEDFDRGFFGDSPIIDTNVSQVIQIVDQATD